MNRTSAAVAIHSTAMGNGGRASAGAPRGRVCVVGAGIGGLVSAIALQRVGFDVVVHEKHAAHRTTGGGLAVQANAMFALGFAGIADAVAAAGVPVRDGLQLRQANGELIKRIPVAAVTRDVFWHDVPTISVSRRRLHDALLGLIDRDAIVLDSELSAFSEDGEGVTATFSSGATVRADLLIGADGIRSCARRGVLGPEPPPRYVGYGTAIGLCHPEAPIAPGENAWYWGPNGQMFGVHDVGDGEVYWWSVKRRPQGSVPPGVSAVEDTLRHFGDWNPRIRALLEATRDDSAQLLDEHDRPPSARWGSGRVTLLGDAAHPMAAFLGQGASQAIEDAIVLTSFLVTGDSGIEPSLRSYEQERRRRTAPVVRTARAASRLQLLEHDWACQLRDAIGRAVPTSCLTPALKGLLQAGFPLATRRRLHALQGALS